MIWLDALDVPFHLFLGSAKFQPGPVNDLPATIPDEVYAVPNIAPEMSPGTANHSPVFRYPYEAAATAVSAAPHALDGSRRVRYMNPSTGGCAMAFIDSHLAQIDALTNTRRGRSTSNAVCCVVEGAGETQVGGETISWRERDIFTLPQGNWIAHRAGHRTARLFVVSDRDRMMRLGLLHDEYEDSRIESST